jgi:hypothetical protein
MVPNELRRLRHRLVDRIADYRDGVAARPVMAQAAPGDLGAQHPAAPMAPGRSGCRSLRRHHGDACRGGGCSRSHDTAATATTSSTRENQFRGYQPRCSCR